MHAFVSEFLTFLELREQRLLSWGFYAVRQTAQEIEEAFQHEASADLQRRWAELSAQGETIRGVLQLMCRRRVIYQIPGTPDSYRSRFAEGVRLIASLRQLFQFQDWAT